MVWHMHSPDKYGNRKGQNCCENKQAGAQAIDYDTKPKSYLHLMK
jgi:hypothetical protein